MSDSRPIFARDLSALVDGELAAATSERLLHSVAEDPASQRTLATYRQLQSTSARVVRSHTPDPAEQLLQRLRAMSPEASTTTTVTPARHPGWSGRFVGVVAAAACVFIAFSAGVWSARRTSIPLGNPSAQELMPASIVAHAEEIHGVCSRLAMGLHSGGYPADVAALAPAVEHDLHSDHPYPDLRPIGYAYRGAGPCGWPLPETAHLLYRSLHPGSVNAISLFVQPWHGQYPLAGGRVYTVSVAQSPFPMLTWRSEHVVYFLLADNAAVEQAALDLIRATAASTMR